MSGIARFLDYEWPGFWTMSGIARLRRRSGIARFLDYEWHCQVSGL